MFRFLISPQNINNKAIIFSERHAKKMRKVLRMKVGDNVEVIDGQGWRYIAELIKITSEEAVGRVHTQELLEETSNIVLFQALPKNLKTEFIIQKSTELGVDKIVFFETEYSQIDATKISKDKVNRWKNIANDASEQSQRMFTTDIELYTGDLDSLLPEINNTTKSFYLDKNGKWLSEFKSNIDLNEINFFIGPEGGFSKKEINAFEKSDIFSIKVSNNVLRAETASSVFLSQLELMHSFSS